MEKRSEFHNDDPLEELSEVFQEVRETETNFKKVLGVCSKYSIYIELFPPYLINYYSFFN
jgi:hypothetical protein